MSVRRFVVNAEAAVTKDDQYLVAKRSAAEDHAAGERSLIGGKVEAAPSGDDPLRETVRLELNEEVGVSVDGLAYVTSGYFVDDGGKPVINVVFLGRWQSGEPSVREPDEIADVGWVSADSLSEALDLPAYTEAYLRAAEARRQSLGW
jgi:8-oxo-dGTP diphosphatase